LSYGPRDECMVRKPAPVDKVAPAALASVQVLAG
jgi:hypothetical protein